MIREGTDIEVAGLDRWIPLDHERDRAELIADLLARFGGDEADDVTRTIVDGLADLAQQTREDAPRLDEAGVLTLGQWVLVDDPAALVPTAMATLRLVRHVDPDPLSVVARLSDGAVLWATPVLEEQDTASGPATFTRVRSMPEPGTSAAVHEELMVIWMRAQAQYAAVLSTYHVDLSGAEHAVSPLRQLAAGVSGL